MRFISLCFFTICAALAPMTSPGADRTLRVGVWAFEAPVEFRPAPGHPGAFMRKIDWPYHTLVLNPLDVRVFEFDEIYRLLPAAGRARVLFVELLGHVDRMRARDEDTPPAPESRFLSVRTYDLPVGMRPDEGVCAGYGVIGDDVGVPGRAGEVHTFRAYQIFCVDFVDGEDSFHLIHLMFSERYCAAMGHKPYAAFEETAARILRSVRFMAGPPHTPLASTPGEGAQIAGVLSDEAGAAKNALATLGPADACAG